MDAVVVDDEVIVDQETAAVVAGRGESVAALPRRVEKALELESVIFAPPGDA